MLRMAQKTKPRAGLKIKMQIKLAIPRHGQNHTDVGPRGVRAEHFGRMSSRSVAFSNRETTKLNIYENTP
jgi:hypothetical protein